MRKLIAIVLIIAILIPAAVLADTEKELTGTWVGSRELADGSMVFFIVRLYGDHTALYEARGLSWDDTDGTDFVYKGTWEHRKDGVHVIYQNFWDASKTDELLLELTQAHLLALRLSETFIVFSKMYDPVPVEKVHPLESWD